MNPTSVRLLDALLDALDDLFDRRRSPAEFHELLREMAGNTELLPLAELIADTESRLERVVTSGASAEVKYRDSLTSTDSLRKQLADALSENPISTGSRD